MAQCALLGSSDVEQYAILLVRVSVGLFFAILTTKVSAMVGSPGTELEFAL